MVNVPTIFARGVWRFIPSEDDASWIMAAAGRPANTAPCGDLGALVKRMLSVGLTPKEVARFARIIGYQVAFQICYHLDDPNASYQGFDDVAPEIDWNLFRVEGGKPAGVIAGIHEVLLAADPSGREMRPVSSA